MRSESEIQLLILEIGSIIILCCGSGSDVGGDGGVAVVMLVGMVGMVGVDLMG